jgi:hypothetical protein
MQRLCNSCRVMNHLVMVLRFNNLAEGFMSLNTRPFRPDTNFRPILQCILHSLSVINNAREDLFSIDRSIPRCRNTLPSYGTLRHSITLRRIYKTIPPPRLQQMKSTNISSVGSEGGDEDVL